MTKKQEWFGVQFNLDEDLGLKKWLERYASKGIKTDGEHVRVELSREDLVKSNHNYFGKLKLIKKVIQKCLKSSSYSNIYSYLDAETLSDEKAVLLSTEFKEPIRVDEFNNIDSITEIFKLKLESEEVKRILTEDGMMKVLNHLFSYLRNRDFATEQKLTLDLRFEDKEEWGADLDLLNVSIQLEIL